MERTTVSVVARTTFEGVHYWSAAPPAVAFLRHPHRHLFVVRATKRVQHDDRDIEFIMLSRAVSNWIAERYPSYGGADEHASARMLGPTSCETLARLILDAFALDECSVFEDDENGAVVIRNITA